jgi:glycerol-3-phosphate dehydrogenase
MPIAEQICRVIYEGLAPRDAVAALMGRAVKSSETQ